MDSGHVGKYYGIVSSFIRVAEVRALNTRAPDPVIGAINLWQNIEQEKETRPMFSILEHYADVVLVLETILQFYSPL